MQQWHDCLAVLVVMLLMMTFHGECHLSTCTSMHVSHALRALLSQTACA